MEARVEPAVICIGLRLGISHRLNLFPEPIHHPCSRAFTPVRTRFSSHWLRAREVAYSESSYRRNYAQLVSRPAARRLPYALCATGANDYLGGYPAHGLE